jgi:hypothetical protein
MAPQLVNSLKPLASRASAGKRRTRLASRSTLRVRFSPLITLIAVHALTRPPPVLSPRAELPHPQGYARTLRRRRDPCCPNPA